MAEPEQSLIGKTIAIPESRQRDIFADLLSRRGAEVLRCPLIAIYDSPNTEAVRLWLDDLIAGKFDDFIILTGEGLRRLQGFAERFNCVEPWHQALGSVRKVVRGPKPVRELRKWKLHVDLAAHAPTTEGIIDTLRDVDLSDRQIAVQLYGSDPNRKLVDFLTGKGAVVSTVAPYIYASDVEEQQVVELIQRLGTGGIDALLFTSQPQYRRLNSVAKKYDLSRKLSEGLSNTVIGAVGPVMADTLKEAGVRVDFMPEESFFMKPLVTALARKLNAADGPG